MDQSKETLTISFRSEHEGAITEHRETGIQCEGDIERSGWLLARTVNGYYGSSQDGTRALMYALLEIWQYTEDGDTTLDKLIGYMREYLGPESKDVPEPADS